MSDLWDGVRFKLDMAQFYLGEMRNDLIPATAERESSYYQTSTVPPMNRWAPKFYYHLDAFLAATRSVDWIITTTFGLDNNNKMKKWIDTLTADEKERRKTFQSQYDAIAKAFRGHLLTHIRNVSIHRSGTPQVEVAVLGRWGEHYCGGPAKSIPTFEQPQRPTVDRDPPLNWMQPLSFAIEPGPDEFIVHEVLPDGALRQHPLFPSCEDYLQSSSLLIKEAENLVTRVHTKLVTPPLLYDI